MLAFSHVCPRCQTSEQLFTSRTKNVFEEVLLEVTFLQAVRCHACYKRFYLPRLFHVRTPDHAREQSRAGTLPPRDLRKPKGSQPAA